MLCAKLEQLAHERGYRPKPENIGLRPYWSSPAHWMTHRSPIKWNPQPLGFLSSAGIAPHFPPGKPTGRLLRFSSNSTVRAFLVQFVALWCDLLLICGLCRFDDCLRKVMLLDGSVPTMCYMKSPLTRMHQEFLLLYLLSQLSSRPFVNVLYQLCNVASAV